MITSEQLWATLHLKLALLEEMESCCCPTHRVASQFLNLFKAFENAGPSCSSSFDVLTFSTFVSFMRSSNTFDAFSLDLYEKIISMFAYLHKATLQPVATSSPLLLLIPILN